MSFLTEKELKRLDDVRRMLDEGINPYSNIRTLTLGSSDTRVSVKHKQVSLKTRLANWYSKPNLKSTITRKVKIDDIQSTSSECLLCLNATDIFRSVKAKVKLQYNKRELVNPSSLNTVTEYITRKGSVLHVDTLKQVSYPTVITGRVCDDCKCNLTIDEILPEYDDRKVEIYSDSSKLGFGRSNE